MPRPPALIRSKIRAPALGAEIIERPRVRRALEAAAEGRAILLVVAAAGSGKTTAVAQLLRARPGPHAWLRLGDADDSPGRFVTYLTAAVAAIDRDAAARTQRLLADGLSPEDCAAILGESLAPGGRVVIDDVHHLEPSPGVLRVLRAFLDAAGPETLAVLVSRRIGRLDLSREMLAGRVGVIQERDLAFRTGEIADLLAARGLEASPEEVEAASGGWAAGIVFEALRDEPANGVSPQPEDPFFAYLGSQVLDALPRELRDVVVRSAVLDVVSPRGLGPLLETHSAQQVFDEICRQHLPGTVEADGLRYHPRFREFLLACLRREQPEHARRLTARYARTLLADGYAEEAADSLLAAGEREEAVPVVECAAPALLRRGDWQKVLAWCADLGEDAPARHPYLRAAQLQSLFVARRHEEVATLVSAMRASGEFDRLLAQAPEVAALAVSVLQGFGDWWPLLELTPPDESSAMARTLRYIFQVGAGEDPPGDWPEGELDRVQPLLIALESVLYYRGRFEDVERLAGAAAGQGPLTAIVAEIYRLLVMCARGEIGDARRAFEAIPSRVRASVFVEGWQQLEAELVFAEGDHEAGLGLMRTARSTTRRFGYPILDRAIFAAQEGRMLVRMGRFAEAAEILGSAQEWCEDRGLAGFREWADTWLAAALLGLGGDPAPARDLLRRAIRGMERAERRLELPAAYVFLAEAAWRLGDEAAHDAAADGAYAASVAMGSLGPLLRALEDMPDVLARRIDAEDRDVETWKALARAGRPAETQTSFDGAAVVVRTLGAAGIAAGDRELSISPSKAIQLAAAVAWAGPGGAGRAELIDELFEGSVDGANYLRQLLHRLRRALPPTVELASDEGRLAWRPAGSVVTEDQVLESLLARARREVNDARLRTLAEALELADRGPFLPDADGAAARRRRDGIAALVSEARRDHARGLLAAGRLGQAALAARRAVAADPYREDGWQLLMRAVVAASGPAAAIPAFLECKEALAEVGLAPSPETGELLERLRGSARPSRQEPAPAPASERGERAPA
jgi:DNA-binding SARP family transcriptional activator/tetratricopeptide (TPR) repeat protein